MLIGSLIYGGISVADWLFDLWLMSWFDNVPFSCCRLLATWTYTRRWLSTYSGMSPDRPYPVVANCLLTTCVRSCRFRYPTPELLRSPLSRCFSSPFHVVLEASCIRHRSTDLLISIAMISSFQLSVAEFSDRCIIHFSFCCFCLRFGVCNVGFHAIRFLRLLRVS